MYRSLNADLVPGDRPRCSETRRLTRGRGGRWGYWRKVSLEEQDSFLPHPHPATHPPLDPPMWRVEPTSAPFRPQWRAGGEMTAGLSEALMKVETLVITVVFSTPPPHPPNQHHHHYQHQPGSHPPTFSPATLRTSLGVLKERLQSIQSSETSRRGLIFQHQVLLLASWTEAAVDCRFT